MWLADVEAQGDKAWLTDFSSRISGADPASLGDGPITQSTWDVIVFVRIARQRRSKQN
jgi:hypothetical protein